MLRYPWLYIYPISTSILTLISSYFYLDIYSQSTVVIQLSEFYSLYFSAICFRLSFSVSSRTLKWVFHTWLSFHQTHYYLDIVTICLGSYPVTRLRVFLPEHWITIFLVLLTRRTKGITYTNERVCSEASLQGVQNEELDSDCFHRSWVDGGRQMGL